MKQGHAIVFILTVATAIAVALFRALTAAHLMPVEGTLESIIVDHAFQVCFYLIIPIFALVIAALIWVVHTSRTMKTPPQWDHSQGWRMETAWLVISTVLTIGLAVFGWTELRKIQRPADTADVDVQITASQFSWEFYYPKQEYFGSALVLPVGKRVRFILTSKDVIHSFWVPEFRLKQDALPGKVTTLYMTPIREGNYILLCNQLCGVDHSVMTANVQVVNEKTFERQFAHGAESW